MRYWAVTYYSPLNTVGRMEFLIRARTGRKAIDKGRQYGLTLPSILKAKGMGRGSGAWSARLGGTKGAGK